MKLMERDSGARFEIPLNRLSCGDVSFNGALTPTLSRHINWMKTKFHAAMGLKHDVIPYVVAHSFAHHHYGGINEKRGEILPNLVDPRPP